MISDKQFQRLVREMSRSRSPERELAQLTPPSPSSTVPRRYGAPMLCVPRGRQIVCPRRHHDMQTMSVGQYMELGLQYVCCDFCTLVARYPLAVEATKEADVVGQPRSFVPFAPTLEWRRCEVCEYDLCHECVHLIEMDERHHLPYMKCARCAATMDVERALGHQCPNTSETSCEANTGREKRKRTRKECLDEATSSLAVKAKRGDEVVVVTGPEDAEELRWVLLLANVPAHVPIEELLRFLIVDAASPHVRVKAKHDGRAWTWELAFSSKLKAEATRYVACSALLRGVSLRPVAPVHSMEKSTADGDSEK